MYLNQNFLLFFKIIIKVRKNIIYNKSFFNYFYSTRYRYINDISKIYQTSLIIILI